MTSCRFGDNRNAECGAWKERVWAEERRARHERDHKEDSRRRVRGVANEGVLGAGHLGCYRGDTASEVSAYSERSAARGSGNSALRHSMEEVTTHIATIEAGLEQEKLSRSDVQNELHELKRLLRQCAPANRAEQSNVISQASESRSSRRSQATR